MAEYRLSVPAEAQIDKILDWSQEKFGDLSRERYAAPPRRPEDVTLLKGYRHPPRISAEELRLGYLRHIPPEARVWA